MTHDHPRSYAKALRFSAEGDDEAAFHRRMDEKPNDFVAPLVYADWLEEHDRPHMAEVIRRDVGGVKPGERRPATYCNRDRFGPRVTARRVPGSGWGLTVFTPGSHADKHFVHQASGLSFADAARLVYGLRDEGYTVGAMTETELEREKNRAH